MAEMQVIRLNHIIVGELLRHHEERDFKGTLKPGSPLLTKEGEDER
jgi:hypothetical protein